MRARCPIVAAPPTLHPTTLLLRPARATNLMGNAADSFALALSKADWLDVTPVPAVGFASCPDVFWASAVLKIVTLPSAFSLAAQPPLAQALVTSASRPPDALGPPLRPSPSAALPAASSLEWHVREPVTATHPNPVGSVTLV